MTVEASQGAVSSTDSKKTEWQNMLDHAGTLEGKDAFVAVMYVMTVIFPTLSEFNEDDQMGKQAKIEDTLTKVQRLRNDLERTFDAFQDLSKESTEKYNTDSKKLAGEAFDDVTQIFNLLSGDANFSPDFVEKVRKELNTVVNNYGYSNEGQKEKAEQNLANYWNGLWHDTEPDKTNNDPNGGREVSVDISPVTNALNSLSSDFSSQSSIVQAKLKLFASYDKQYKAMEDDMMTKFEKEVQAPNRAMQSAGS